MELPKSVIDAAIAAGSSQMQIEGICKTVCEFAGPETKFNATRLFEFAHARNFQLDQICQDLFDDDNMYKLTKDGDVEMHVGSLDSDAVARAAAIQEFERQQELAIQDAVGAGSGAGAGSDPGSGSGSGAGSGAVEFKSKKPAASKTRHVEVIDIDDDVYGTDFHAVAAQSAASASASAPAPAPVPAPARAIAAAILASMTPDGFQLDFDYNPSKMELVQTASPDDAQFYVSDKSFKKALETVDGIAVNGAVIDPACRFKIIPVHTSEYLKKTPAQSPLAAKSGKEAKRGSDGDDSGDDDDSDGSDDGSGSDGSGSKKRNKPKQNPKKPLQGSCRSMQVLQPLQDRDETNKEKKSNIRQCTPSALNFQNTTVTVGCQVIMNELGKGGPEYGVVVARTKNIAFVQPALCRLGPVEVEAKHKDSMNLKLVDISGVRIMNNLMGPKASDWESLQKSEQAMAVKRVVGPFVLKIQFVVKTRLMGHDAETGVFAEKLLDGDLAADKLFYSAKDGSRGFDEKRKEFVVCAATLMTVQSQTYMDLYTRRMLGYFVKCGLALCVKEILHYDAKTSSFIVRFLAGWYGFPAFTKKQDGLASLESKEAKKLLKQALKQALKKPGKKISPEAAAAAAKSAAEGKKDDEPVKHRREGSKSGNSHVPYNIGYIPWCYLERNVHLDNDHLWSLCMEYATGINMDANTASGIGTYTTKNVTSYAMKPDDVVAEILREVDVEKFSKLCGLRKTLRNYQVETVKTMIQTERNQNSPTRPFWAKILEYGEIQPPMMYSPFMQSCKTMVKFNEIFEKRRKTLSAFVAESARKGENRVEKKKAKIAKKDTDTIKAQQLLVDEKEVDGKKKGAESDEKKSKKKVKDVDEKKKTTKSAIREAKDLEEFLKPKVSTLLVDRTYDIDCEGSHFIPAGRLNASEQGLGKTIISTALITANPATEQDLFFKRNGKLVHKRISGLPICKATLICTTASTAKQWCNEINAWSRKKLTIIDMDIVAQKNQVLTQEDFFDADVVVLSHKKMSTLFKKKSALMTVAFHRAIFDEAHELKNKGTLMYQNFMAIKTRLRHLLSGTPAKNIPDLNGLVSAFQIPVFCGADYWNMIAVAEKISKYNKGHAYADVAPCIQFFKHLVSRHEKNQKYQGSDVLEVLPDVEKKTTLIDFTLDERKVYDAFVQQALEEIENFIKAGGQKTCRDPGATHSLVRCTQAYHLAQIACSYGKINFAKVKENLKRFDEARRRIADERKRIAEIKNQVEADLARQRLAEEEKKLADEMRLHKMSFQKSDEECGVCLGPFDDPRQNQCMHICCKACWDMTEAAQGRCPMCRAEIILKTTPVLFLDHIPKEEENKSDALAKTDADGDREMKPADDKKDRREDDGVDDGGGGTDDDNNKDPDQDEEMKQGSDIVCIKSKLDYLIQRMRQTYCDHDTASEDVTLIYSHYPATIKQLYERLRRTGIRVMLIRSSDPQSVRDAKMTSFNDKSEGYQIAVLSGRFNTGVNLQRANVVICFDAEEKLEQEKQMWARVHRIGQTRKVYFERLIMRDTIEHEIETANKLREESQADGSVSFGTKTSKKKDLSAGQHNLYKDRLNLLGLKDFRKKEQAKLLKEQQQQQPQMGLV